MSIQDIIFKYQRSEATLEETNAALKEAGANFSLDPNRTKLTPEQIAATTVGETPAEANGFGFLDSGTGPLDPIEIVNGKTKYPINSVDEEGICHSMEFVLIGGKRYRVIVDTLVDIVEE